MQPIEPYRTGTASRRSVLGMVAATAAGGLFPFSIPSAEAQDMSNNAHNFYVSDQVTLEKVRFPTQYRTQVAGNLFTPKDLDPSAKRPAIIVGHPMGAVKEQSANLYAAKMAERGFITLSIDLPFWGESEGAGRNLVSPDRSARRRITCVRRSS